MNREYFPAKFRLDNATCYFLWSRDLEADFDNDQVWTQNNLAPAFKTLAQAQDFAAHLDFALVNEGEPLLHDLDYVRYWLRLKKMKRALQFWPGNTLGAWNIFSDLARSLSMPFLGDAKELTPLWSKLLVGDDHHRVTRWSGRELQATHEVLAEGLKMWRQHVRKQTSYKSTA